MNLALWNIECAFCGERGNFELEVRREKKKPNSEKRLHFDIYKCNNCAGFVHVLWSASDTGRDAVHSYEVLPWPLKAKPKAPDCYSPELARFWVQAHTSLRNEAWDAASAMARSALQLALRENNANGKRLVDQIEDLASRGLLPPIMKEWATEVRLLGNDAVHPEPGQDEPDPQDVQQAVNYLDFLLYCLNELPAKIAAYRARRTSE